MKGPERIPPARSAAFNLQRRRRNWAIFVALALLMLLLYAITIVKLSKS